MVAKRLEVVVVVINNSLTVPKNSESDSDKSDDRSVQRPKSEALLALTAAALMLPALSQEASADTPPENIKLGYRFSSYGEDATDAAKTFGSINNASASSERYDIDVNQFSLLMPLAVKYSLAVDVQTESLSGASPWFTGEANGQAKLVMSGASIKEDRQDIGANLRYYASEGNAGITLSRSSENDYESFAIGFDGSYNINDKHTTFNGGVSFSDDELEPTQGLIPAKVTKEDKDSASLFLGLGQVINKNTVIQTGLSFTRLSGYLTDPYKNRDQRPDKRNQSAWSFGIRHYLPSADAALHGDYRFYHDDWGINSHTFDFAWYQNVKSYFQVIAYGRYYSQQEARFFSNNAQLSEQYFADDFRLSSYSAVTVGLRLETSYQNWRIIVAGERYNSGGHYSIYSVDERSPGLVSFDRFTVGVDYEFN